MGIVCWQNNLPLEHLGFSIAETPTTKYVGPNFIKRRHIKSQTLEHDFTNTKSDPLSAYCINSCFSCMCVCDVPRRDRFVTTMGDNRGMKGHESMDWMFVDLRWSNHLVFHCRSSLLGAWCLANSIRISHPVVFDSQPVNTQLTSSDRDRWFPLFDDMNWNRVAFGCFSKYNLIQPVEVGTGCRWNPRCRWQWMAMENSRFMDDLPTQTSIYEDLMLPLHIIATPDPVFHGMMPHIHLYILVLIQLYIYIYNFSLRGFPLPVPSLLLPQIQCFINQYMNQYIINQLIKLTIENPRT